MIQATLSEAAKWSDARLIGQDAEFNGIAIDSRHLEPGTLFVAIKSNHVDGHDYIKDAKSRYARAALASRKVPTSLPILLVKDSVLGLGKLAAVWRQLHEIPVIGVLSSNGKTTVKDIIATIFAETLWGWRIGYPKESK